MAAEPLRIAVIGGLTRATNEWRRAGAAIGAIVEHHDGQTAGSRAAALAAIVRRADVVVSILVPNSHGAVAIARRTAASHHRTFLLFKHLRPSGLAAVISAARDLDRAQVARCST
jgi:hypothetical protein